MRARSDSIRRVHPIAVASFALLVATLVPARGLAAVPSKPFRADLDGVPSPIAAGSTATVSLTISNDSASSTLGSSDVAAPAGYVLPDQTITIPSPGTATVVGGTVIELRDLGLAPLSSLTLAFTAIVPCRGNAPWSLDAKPTGDHSGRPAFKLDTAGSDLVTEIGGSCHLGFVVEPADAELGSNDATESEPITGAPFDAGADPVSVEVLDGADERVSTSTAAITLALQGGTAGAVLRLNGSTDVTANAEGGVATFPGLTIDVVGFDYELVATSPDIDPGTSAPFDVVTFGQVCEGGTCDSPTAETDSGTGSAHASNVPAGMQLEIAFAGDDPCGGTGYVPVSPDTFTVLALDPDGTPSEGVVLEITLAVFKDQVLASGRRLREFEVCFATDVPGKTFVDKTGAVVSQGLLPGCTRDGDLDCVVSRTKDRTTGDVTVVFRVLDGRGKI